MATKNIEPKLRLISEYLELGEKEIFQIPEYQRAYSWGTVQCDKLWQDIEAFIESGAEDPYFFGTIIIDCSHENQLNLIDGQQRTTTFLLILKALHLKIKNALNDIIREDDTEALVEGLRDSYNKILTILYKADSDKRVEIKKDWNKAKGITIIENNSINELYKSDISTIIEAENYSEAENNVNTIKWKKKDNKYTNFFRNFKFFYERLSDYSESKLNKFAKVFLTKCQIIEIRSWQIEQAITMFNSLNSTGMPLSDADIISAQLYSNSSDQKGFSEQWKRITALANELSLCKIVDIDAILQESMYILRTQNKEYKENEVATPGVRKYYTYEHPELLKDPVRICNFYEKILGLWDKIKNYPVIRLMLKFNENSKLFLISYLNRFDIENINESNISTMVECLLRLFAVNELVDAGYSSSKFKTFLFNENFHLIDLEYSIEQIKIDFDTHINESWNEADLKAEITDYSKNVLVFLNEYLFAKSKNIAFELADNVNIEHIMPSSGHNLNQIRIDAGINDKDEFDIYANKLGNKILLEEDINKSIGNDWFRTKKDCSVKDKKGYRDSRFGLALSLAQSPKCLWTKKDIDDATDKAAERILDFIFNRK